MVEVEGVMDKPLLPLDEGIKALMDRHAGVGEALSRAGIGCVDCSLGTCRVKDVLEIHNLDTESSRALLTELGQAIFQGAPFTMPVIERKAAPVKASFCPPIARMVEEHTRIKRVIACLPSLGARLETDETAWTLASRVLDFIRNYADRYHHAKEEDILFGFFDENSDVLGVMFQDHRDGWAHVAAAQAAIDSKNVESFRSAAEAYGKLLSGHIQREDEILYPWMDRTLTTRQVGEMFSRCMTVEARFADIVKGQEAFVEELEAAMG